MTDLDPTPVLMPFDVEYLTLIENPFECRNRNGQVLMANGITVSLRADGEAFTSLSGTNIKADGTVGKQRRYAWFALRRGTTTRDLPEAPFWLQNVLEAAGVRW